MIARCQSTESEFWEILTKIRTVAANVEKNSGVITVKKKVLELWNKEASVQLEDYGHSSN